MRIRVARLLDSLVITLLATRGSTARLVAGKDYQDCVLSNPPWSECSKNCGEEERFRDRKIEKLPWGQGHYPCSRFSAGVITYKSDGTYYREREACNNGKCQDCVLSNPGWSGCTKNCGGGEQTRDRRVLAVPQGGGIGCSSLTNGVQTYTNSGTYFMESKPCNTRKCLDCVVRQWGSWGACSGASCFPGGTQTRRRSVRTNPETGGEACPKLTEEQTCNTQACPADCEWEIRRDEGNCLGDCGEGLMNVTLVTVVTKEAEGDGKPCNETQVITETCDSGMSCPGTDGGTLASSTTLTTAHLMIGLGAMMTVAPIALCLLVICVKKYRKKPEETEVFAGDLNEDYGIYYSAAGERVEIESEVRDVNPLYQSGEE